MRYLPILLLFLVACSPQKKLAKLLAKHPELRDTTVVVDTITIVQPERVIDTVFRVTSDTVVIERERIKVRYHQSHDTVWIEATAKADTIHVPYRVEVPTVQPVQYRNRMPLWVPLVLVGLVLALLVALSRG